MINFPPLLISPTKHKYLSDQINLADWKTIQQFDCLKSICKRLRIINFTICPKSAEASWRRHAGGRDAKRFARLVGRAAQPAALVVSGASDGRAAARSAAYAARRGVAVRDAAVDAEAAEGHAGTPASVGAEPPATTLQPTVLPLPLPRAGRQVCGPGRTELLPAQEINYVREENGF